MPYVKTSVRTTSAGTVRYLQLAHNEWDQASAAVAPRVLYSFGREDQLDKDAVRRLVTALSRLLDPAEALAAADRASWRSPSSARGGTLRPGPAVAAARDRDDPGRARSSGPGRPRDAARAERVLFALVANRALAAVLQARRRRLDLPRRAHRRPGRDHRRRVLPGDGLAARGRAATWPKQVYYQVADLLNLEVDLLFFDYPANRVRDLALAA